jgi:putative ABC transport system ATP-binding protein
MNTPEPEILISTKNLCHSYGKGALLQKILSDIDTEISAGEIVILTGPSGSGKTTLLTLMGALRSAQEGSLKILGTELRGASAGTLQAVRRQIGYIFQAHNLLGALTACQNVAMSLYLQPGVSRGEARKRAKLMLESVGLADHVNKYPSALSGGQRQRVGIARALVAEPRIVLADEPTASLDKQSGRDVVELMKNLAKEQGTTVIMVTHDNRILDVADRILSLEDGKIKSLSGTIAEGASQLLTMLERHDPRTSHFISAFSGALARVAFADNEITDDERQVMREVLTEVSGLSSTEVDLAVELAMAQVRMKADSTDEGEQSASFTPMERDKFIESLYAVANADGVLTDDEREEIEEIASEMGFPKEPDD